MGQLKPPSHYLPLPQGERTEVSVVLAGIFDPDHLFLAKRGDLGF